MVKDVMLLNGFVEHCYHTIPGKLEQITIAPEREDIFKHLAQIGPDRFHEFVLDILILVEGHQGDITNGPGDEKQDILTINSQGERCLTQCKHTIHYDNNSSGDELDQLFSACMRKNCKKAIYVTNADLTVQAKRYVTDQEYMRGWNGPREFFPEIMYWNGSILWDKIANNNAILNKWFGGMCQAHGLRKFHFDIVVTKQPNGQSVDGINSQLVTDYLSQKYSIQANSNTGLLELILDDGAKVNFSDNIISDLDIGMTYIPPNNGKNFINVPIRCVRVQAVVADQIGQYDPVKYRDNIMKLVAEALPELGEDEWWHLITTKSTAFVFFQDIGEPRTISISSAQSYVKIGNKSAVEKEWAFPRGEKFIRVISDDVDDDLTWEIQDLNIRVTTVFEQRQHPIDEYQYMTHFKGLIQKANDYDFYVIENFSSEELDIVRRIISPLYLLMKMNEDLIIAAPPDEGKTKDLINVLMERGTSVLNVAPEDKLKIIEAAEKDLRPIYALISNEVDLVFPISLNKRMYMFAASVDRATILVEQWIKLVELKTNYEARCGFDFMHGKESGQIASEEIPGLLADFTTLRGTKMLDIAWEEEAHEVIIIGRFREDSTKAAVECLQEYLTEFQQIIKDIEQILNNTDLS